MPPKVKITREDIVNAAIDVVRKGGAQALNARMIASILNCSTQPVFSNFATMDELRRAVSEKADQIFREYMRREEESGKYPPYKSAGMAYIRFAKEENELFRLLYMCDRPGAALPEKSDLADQMESAVHQNTGLSSAEAGLFQMEMWAYVHGIAAMFATGFLDIEWELVSRMLTDVYQGLRKQYGME